MPWRIACLLQLTYGQHIRRRMFTLPSPHVPRSTPELDQEEGTGRLTHRFISLLFSLLWSQCREVVLLPSHPLSCLRAIVKCINTQRLRMASRAGWAPGSLFSPINPLLTEELAAHEKGKRPHLRGRLTARDWSKLSTPGRKEAEDFFYFFIFFNIVKRRKMSNKSIELLQEAFLLISLSRLECASKFSSSPCQHPAC